MYFKTKQRTQKTGKNKKKFGLKRECAIRYSTQKSIQENFVSGKTVREKRSLNRVCIGRVRVQLHSTRHKLHWTCSTVQLHYVGHNIQRVHQGCKRRTDNISARQNPLTSVNNNVVFAFIIARCMILGRICFLCNLLLSPQSTFQALTKSM